MKTTLYGLAVLVCLSAFWGTSYADSITYTYDAQHRLVQASYSAAQKVFYNYDSAGNVDQHVTITDAKYLESWLLYFTMIEPLLPGPATTLRDVWAAMLTASTG